MVCPGASARPALRLSRQAACAAEEMPCVSSAVSRAIPDRAGIPSSGIWPAIPAQSSQAVDRLIRLQTPAPVSKKCGKVNSLTGCNALILHAIANPYRLAAVNSLQRIRGGEKRKLAEIRTPQDETVNGYRPKTARNLGI